MPWKEGCPKVRFLDGGIPVHIAKVAECPEASVVERSERGPETVTLGVGQRVRVLADPYHHWGDRERGVRTRVDHLDCSIAVVGAGSTESAGDEEVDRRATGRQGEIEFCLPGTRDGREEDDLASLACISVSEPDLERGRAAACVGHLAPNGRLGEIACSCAGTTVYRDHCSHIAPRPTTIGGTWLGCTS